jgi:L-amino acid N-acyltransferase YncA
MTAVIARPTDTKTISRLDQADARELLAMYQRCSPETTYRRWHGHLRAFPAAYLAAMAAGSDEHIAVVARRDGQVAGFASAAEVAPGIREIGVLVEDRWQRHGIGRALLSSLVADSKALGTRVIRAEVLADDAGLVETLRRFGATPAATTTATASGVITAQVQLPA